MVTDDGGVSADLLLTNHIGAPDEGDPFEPDDLPEEGDAVDIEYTSRRSGNPKSRTGEVTAVRPEFGDGGDKAAVYALTERKSAVKRVYTVAVFDPDDTDAAYSMTATMAADLGGSLEDAGLSTSVRVSFESERTQTLGPLEEVLVR